MKKITIFQATLAICFLLFLLFILSAKNYTKEYTIKDVTIKETYDKENKNYYFTFQYNDIILDYLTENKYKQHRGYVEDLKIINEDNDFCLIPESSKMELIPLCYENQKIIHFSKVKSALKNKLPEKYQTLSKRKEIGSFNDIKIYNNDYTYLIWSYNGFNYLSNKENKKIKIFDRELYTINLVGYTKDYLVIADYDSNYTFNRFYTINYKNGNLKKHDIDRSIYFDSYFIGNEKNNLYIVDNKASTMYELNSKNGKINKFKPRIIENGEWQKKNIKTLINKPTTFNLKSNFHYIYENNTLSIKYKDITTFISNNVKQIIKTTNQDIFYLKNDSLYHFNPETGEELLLTYFDWNFNYENMIYIH